MLRPSFCRFCHHGCPILVEVRDGRAVRVTGDDGNPLYQGYTCVKGRALPEQHYHPERLLHSQVRQADGSHQPIASERLMDEVADRLRVMVERHGPRAVAFYFASGMVVSSSTAPVGDALRRAIGSPMMFTADTIDQPGKHVAKALHGMWMAPPQGFDRPEVALIVGANPLVSYAGGLPMGHPGKQLRRWLDDGLFLIVVDPRRSDTAKRASLHLQPRPGQDVAILAGMLRVILTENLYDAEFVAENVDGVERLREVVGPFTPEHVGALADIDAHDLVTAARRFASATRGYAVGSTGPNMSGRGTLFEYLVLNLNTLCGRWLRAGERVAAPPTLLPVAPPKAQARPPFPGYGYDEELRGTGLRQSFAGLPVAGLPGDILSDAPDRVRALFSVGGNPVAAWPDQLKVVEAMRALDLLVQVDIKMSATAKLAHYVVAPTMSLETPSYNYLADQLPSYAVGYIGPTVPWSQYTDAVVRAPEGSDVMPEWEFFYGVAQRMGLQLDLPAQGKRADRTPITFDMLQKPTSDDIIAMCTTASRVPLDEVQRHARGAIFEEPAVVVAPKDHDWTGRLDVANEQMMSDLVAVSHEPMDGVVTTESGDVLDFRLVSRRLQQTYNSSGRALKPMRKRRYNPAFIHPDDLERLGLRSGDTVVIRSARSSIYGIVEPDDSLRQGLVSMTHAFGDAPEHDRELRTIGSSTGRLLTIEEFQPYTGQPQMSNIPVSVTRVDEGEVVTSRGS